MIEKLIILCLLVVGISAVYKYRKEREYTEILEETLADWLAIDAISKMENVNGTSNKIRSTTKGN